MDLLTQAAIAAHERLHTYLQSKAETIRAEKWNTLLQNAVNTFPEEQKRVAETVLRNQVVWLDKETIRTQQSIPQFKIPKAQEVLFRVAVEYMRRLNVYGIVSVQPISGPVGLVYGMRYTKREEDMLSLEILSQSVQAQTKRLSASWTLEAQQDIESLHGIDFEEEIIRAVGREISTETITEIVRDLVHLAEDNEQEYTLREGVCAEQTMRELAVHINKVGVEIARRTRRGCGNYIVVSPTVLAFLQSQKAFEFVPTEMESMELFSFAHVGDLHYNDKLMYKVYLTVAMPSEETILVGYQGSSPVDTGYIFCPFVPVMSSGVVVDPVTFEPRQALMTRYAKTSFDADDARVEMKGSYYGRVQVRNLLSV